MHTVALSGKLARLTPRVLFKRVWLKYFVQHSKLDFTDDSQRCDFAYTVADPWSLSSPLERHRFQKTSDAINRVIGNVNTVLEIGSAEGYHTQWLLEQCGSVDGIECSARAIARAKKRCPRARFFQAWFPELPEGLRPCYDLVIAAESIYYCSDIEAGLNVLNNLGRYCLVTFHEGHNNQLKPIFDRIPGAIYECIEHSVCNWNLYLWESSTAAMPT
jgi:ubiquinone/menaquinone biosynthesis C-methylase UbiE